MTKFNGKYLIHNRWAKAMVRRVDAILSWLPKKNREVPLLPKKILVANLAHMGDVLLMTALLKELKALFPDAHIGVLIGSWSKPILEEHPCVDNIHTLDHWKLNRSRRSKWKKLAHYLRTRKNALKEIKAAHYEVAIDAYSYYPNSAPLFWQCNIPARIGYTSGGFGPLLTHPTDRSVEDQHVVSTYIPLLQFFNREIIHLRPYLPRSTLAIDSLLERHGIKKEFILIHMGTGNAKKEWPIEHWRSLVQKFEGICIVFTGKGREEKKRVDIVAAHGSHNLVDEISWAEYLCFIQHAKCLIGVDSLAGHLAAALDTPAVLIYSGMNSLTEWKPLSPLTQIITHYVPCAPCFRKEGCPSMRCIRDITPKEVYNVVLMRLKHYNSSNENIV